MGTAVEEKNMKSAVIVPTRTLNKGHGRLARALLQSDWARSAYLGG